MGQVVGKLSFYPPVQPFLNLSGPSLASLLSAFRTSSPSFGLDAFEMQSLFSASLVGAMADFGGLSDDAVAALISELFVVFDDDGNGVVDALEVLSTLALTSAMSLDEKVCCACAIFPAAQRCSPLRHCTAVAARGRTKGGQPCAERRPRKCLLLCPATVNALAGTGRQRPPR